MVAFEIVDRVHIAAAPRRRRGRGRKRMPDGGRRRQFKPADDVRLGGAGVVTVRKDFMLGVVAGIRVVVEPVDEAVVREGGHPAGILVVAAVEHREQWESGCGFHGDDAGDDRVDLE